MPSAGTDTRPGPLSWLLAPATDEAPRGHAVVMAGLRILLGLLWLYNVSWKRAPDFGREAGSGLYKYTRYAVEYPVFPPYSWVVENLVLPAFTIFGVAVLIVETALAVMLLTGSWVRLAALLGVAQSLAIGLSVAKAPEEWPWSYWLMIGAHAVLVLGAGGRVLAVDAVRAGRARPRTLGLTWGVVGLLVGAYSVIASLGDPLAGRGPGLRYSGLSVSLGTYNLLGGALLVLAAGLLLLSAVRALPQAGWAGALLALAAAVSLHAQLGFSTPLLGGNPTSAAFFLAVAVVAAAVARHPGSTRSGTHPSSRTGTEAAAP